MFRRLAWLTSVIAASTLVAGCGLANPYTTTTTRSPTRTTSDTTTPAADHDPTPERGGTIPNSAELQQTKPSRSAGEPTPIAALKRYAEMYINWTATSVAAIETDLASISIDSARAQALQAASSYRHDTTLLRSHVRNSGTVVAISRGEGAAALGAWVVVTRETTTGKGEYQGLPAQLHVTYAQLKKCSAGWTVSSWSPQS
jgi:hypothetical protein